MKKAIILLVLLCPFLLKSQEQYILSTGKRVIINKNGTWKTDPYPNPDGEEVRLSNGIIAVLYSNGTWKEKVMKKPTIEWVSIPAGRFTMGSTETEKNRDADEVQHEVNISAFRMSKYEVTFTQYDKFCEATGRQKPNDNGWGRGNRPVINVNWYDAVAFAKWIGKGVRLPTEAEWEYACRAGTPTAYNIGNTIVASQANYCSQNLCRRQTVPVGSFPANAWGLYDMHGNVDEWCNDWYGTHYYENSQNTNPHGPQSGSKRVCRGGSWANFHKFCRSADRSGTEPGYKSTSIGFRLVSTH